MDEKDLPRVKLPEMPPDPINSAGNSWAQSTSRRQNSSSTTNTTNRAKYENTKLAPPSAMTLAIPMPVSKGRTQVQPAIPILPPSKDYRQEQHHKNRAVTDPVAQNKAFEGRKLSIKSMRAKFAGEHNPNAIKVDGRIEHHPNEIFASISPSKASLVSPALSSKAARVMGYYPVSKDVNNDHHPEPPASAPPTTFASDPFHVSSESNAGPSRQAQSTPVQGRPTKRWLKENNITPSLDENPAPVMVSTQPPKSSPGNLNAMILGDGKLSPSKTGAYGLVSQVEIKEGFKRVVSQQGIVESVLDQQEGEEGGGDYNQYSAPLSGTSTATNPFPEETDNPASYLRYPPSTDDGVAEVWKNNRNVGRTLPPFSPRHAPDRLDPNAEVQRSRDTSEGTIQMTYNRQPDNRGSSIYAPSFGSTNSWAASGHTSSGNTFAQSDNRPSAIIPHLFALENNNFVPPPPMSFPGFQPSTGPVPPGIAHLEATLHHHMDACFERLSRMIVDKTDKVVDELIGRSENLEEKLSKNINSLSCQLGDVKKELGILKDEAFSGTKIGNELKESTKGLGNTLKTLEHKVEETACHCQHRSFVDHEASTQARIGQQYSAQDSMNAPDHRNPNNFQTTSSQRRISNVSTPATPHRRNYNNHHNARRSNALNGSELIRRNETYGSQDIRAQFSDGGRAVAPEPDLNLHPAYANVGPTEYGIGGEPIGGVPLVLGGPGGVLYQLPSYRDGAWYQAARGAGRGYE